MIKIDDNVSFPFEAVAYLTAKNQFSIHIPAKVVRRLKIGNRSELIVTLQTTGRVAQYIVREKVIKELN